MPIPLKGLEDLTGESAAAAIGFGLGVALGRALEPLATKISYEAWRTARIKVPDAVLLAEGVAQGQVNADTAHAWAADHGFGTDAFNAMIDIANTGPAIGSAFAAWRRGELSEEQFTTALRRTGLEEEWYPAIRSLKAERLDLGALATSIHRGIVAGQGLIVTEPPQGAGLIPHVPQSELDAIEEAASHGIDPERLRIMVGNTGLPPGLMEMLALLNRGHATEDDVRRAVANSNLRNEYMDVVLNLRRRLLTPTQYIEARLRGWIDVPAMRAGAALSGMEADDADLLAKLSGRPISFRQVFIGERRGGHYDGPTGEIAPAFLKSLQESNIRPEWYELAWAQRYTYPSAFVLRALVTDGDLSAAEGEKILLNQGWEPTLAAKVAAKWAGSVAGAGKQETKAELEDEYAGGYMDEAAFRAALGALGYEGDVQDLLVHLNDARRLKRYREKVVDAVAKAYIGRALTVAEAQAELEAVSVTGKASSDLLRLWDLIARAANA